MLVHFIRLSMQKKDFIISFPKRLPTTSMESFFGVWRFVLLRMKGKSFDFLNIISQFCDFFPLFIARMIFWLNKRSFFCKFLFLAQFTCPFNKRTAEHIQRLPRVCKANDLVRLVPHWTWPFASSGDWNSSAKVHWLKFP